MDVRAILWNVSLFTHSYQRRSGEIFAVHCSATFFSQAYICTFHLIKPKHVAHKIFADFSSGYGNFPLSSMRKTTVGFRKKNTHIFCSSNNRNKFKCIFMISFIFFFFMSIRFEICCISVGALFSFLNCSLFRFLVRFRPLFLAFYRSPTLNAKLSIQLPNTRAKLPRIIFRYTKATTIRNNPE